MKIILKSVKNGWLAHYEIWESPAYPMDAPYRKVGEEEKAFTYDFEDEKEDAWRRLEWFVSSKFIDLGLHRKIYLQSYDEEKGEWVGRQELKRRRDEKQEMKRLKEFDESHSGPSIPLTKEEKRIFKKWDKEKASEMTPETWEIECAKSIFDRLLGHFKKNACMDYEEYVEIKNAAVKQFTKRFGLKLQI